MIRVGLETHEQAPLVKAATSNLEAYQLYLKGRALLYKRGLAVPRALECFKQAVALDDKYALAGAGLADSYTTLGYNGFAHPAATVPRDRGRSTRGGARSPTCGRAQCVSDGMLDGHMGKGRSRARVCSCARTQPPV